MRLGKSRNAKSPKLNPSSTSGYVSAGLHELEEKVQRLIHSVVKHLSATFHHHDDGEELPASKVRQGIVSINGQDVETMRCTGRRTHR